MSPFKTLIRWLARHFAPARPRQFDLDALSLHDWADLPPHHPQSLSPKSGPRFWETCGTAKR